MFGVVGQSVEDGGVEEAKWPMVARGNGSATALCERVARFGWSHVCYFLVPSTSRSPLLENSNFST